MKENVKENCKEAIKEQLERNHNYLLHKIEEFDPYDYLEPATDWSTGESIVDPETGEFKMFLPVRAQVTWFRLKNPRGKIVVEKVESPSGYVCFEARVYESREDDKEAYLAIAYTEKAKAQDAAFPAFETCQTAAIGRALTYAGYGCEIKTYVSGEQFAPVPSPAENEIQANVQLEQTEKAMPVPEVAKPKITKPKADNSKTPTNPLEIFIQKATQPEAPEVEKTEVPKEIEELKEVKAKEVKQEKPKEIKEEEPKQIKVEECKDKTTLGSTMFDIIEGTNSGNISLHVGQSLDEINTLKPSLLQMISNTQTLRDCVPADIIKVIDEYIEL